MDTKKGRRRFRTRWRTQDTELTLLALPTTIWYILFCFLPMFGVIIAFKDFKIFGGFLSNVIPQRMVRVQELRIPVQVQRCLGRHPQYAGLQSGVHHPGHRGARHLGADDRPAAQQQGRKVYQTMMFLPYFLSWVVVSAIAWAFLSFDKGIANQFLADMGKDPVNWYMEPKYWPYFLVFMNIHGYCGGSGCCWR